MWKTLPVPDRSARIIGIQFTKWQQVSGAKNEKFLDNWIILVQNFFSGFFSSFREKANFFDKGYVKSYCHGTERLYFWNFAINFQRFSNQMAAFLSTILESQSLHSMQNIFFSRTSLDLRTVERKAAPNPPNRMNFPRSIISNSPIPFCLNTFLKKIFFCYKGLFSLNIAVQIPSNLRIS